jgi:ABC-type taurine transport system substrate-binding protein
MYNSYGGVSDTIDSTIEFLKKNGHIKTESLDDYQDYLDEYLKLLYNYNFLNPYHFF